MAMKWIEITKAKDLKPGKDYLTTNKKGAWDKLTLDEIKLDVTGTSYLFSGFEGHQYTDITHIIDIDNNLPSPEPPKNNQ